MILSQIFRRILRSLRRPSLKRILPKFSAGLLVWILFLSLSCSSTRHVQTLPIESIRKDTLYISTQFYDSIYITRTSDTDRTRDTITITKTMTEYRFRLLRDTIFKTRIDSIPYEVRITEVKEVSRPRNLFDYISYVCTIVITTIIVLKLIITTKRIIL